MKEKLEEKYQEYVNSIVDMIFDDNGEIVIKNKNYKMAPEESFFTDLNYLYKDYDGETDRIIIESEITRDKRVYNVMDMEGNLISNKWYSFIGRYNDGFAVVKDENDKWNYIDKNGVLLFDEWFDEADYFSEGYAVTKTGNKHTIVNTKGDKVFETDKYIKMYGCHDGFFMVEGQSKSNNYYRGYNYIDINGNLLIRQDDDNHSEKWLSIAHNFGNGLACISSSILIGTDYYVDKNGQYPSDKWKAPYPWVIGSLGDFHDGWASVMLRKAGSTKNYYNYISPTGKFMFDVSDKIIAAADFKNGIATYVYRAYDGSHSISITPDGKEVYTCDGLSLYHCQGLGEGFFYVCNRNYIQNVEGTVKIENVDLDHDAKFKNGKLFLKKDRLCYAMDTKGVLTQLPLLKGMVKKLPTYISYDGNACFYMDENGIDKSAHYYIEKELYPGIFNVTLRGKHSLLSIEKKDLILPSYYDMIDVFRDGWAMVMQRNRKEEKCYNYVNKDGQFLFEDWITGITCHPIENGYIPVTNNGKISLMDLNGKIIFPYIKNTSYVFYSNDHIASYPNFLVYKGKAKPKKIELDGYSANASPFGYIVKNGKNKYVLKCKPIKTFGKRYIICLNKNDVVLYDTVLGEDKNLGKVDEVSYDDNIIIINKKPRTVYLQYNNSLLDISDYYKNTLIKKKEIHIKQGIKVLSIDDYHNMNEDDIKRLVKEERERLDEEKEERIRKEEEKRLQEQIKAKEQERKQDLQEYKDTSDKIQQLTEKLEVLSEKVGIPIRFKVKWLFVTAGEYKVLNPKYVENRLINYIDFSGETFEDVYVAGKDYRGLNIDSLNPQKVWNKDLSNCNFEGTYFHVSTKFDGVNICGSKFTSSNNFTVFDINKESLSCGIYDEYTTLDGVPLVELLNKKERSA